MTHYERLSVAPTASADELRDAYRRAARASHPDRHGDRSAGEMAAVNEAWRVLGDPDRRRRYDAELRAGQATTMTSPHSAPRAEPTPSYVRDGSPAQFPWRFMTVMAVLGIGFVISGVILYEQPTPPAIDNVLRTGDCVSLTGTLEAAEAPCAGPHDAIVQVLVPFDVVCPTGTEAYRDRQGMGTACVVRVTP